MDSTDTARRLRRNDAAPRPYAEITSAYGGHPPIYAALVAEWEARGHAVPEHRDGQWVSFAAPSQSETWTAVPSWTAGPHMGPVAARAVHPAADRAMGPGGASGVRAGGDRPRGPGSGPGPNSGPGMVPVGPGAVPVGPGVVNGVRPGVDRPVGPGAVNGVWPGSDRPAGPGPRLTSRPVPPAPH